MLTGRRSTHRLPAIKESVLKKGIILECCKDMSIFRQQRLESSVPYLCQRAVSEQFWSCIASSALRLGGDLCCVQFPKGQQAAAAQIGHLTCEAPRIRSCRLKEDIAVLEITMYETQCM